MKKYIISTLVISILLITPIFSIKQASASDLSIRDFVNLLITIGAITPDKMPAVNAYLASLSQDNNTPTPPRQTTYSADTLYSGLSPRLAYVTCNWYNRYGAILFSKISNGLLGPKKADGSGYFINTVLGGVTDTEWAGSLIVPSSCTIQFPAGSSLYAGGLSTITTGSYNTQLSPVIVGNTDIDTAQISINIPNNYLATYSQNNNYCLSRPSTGDSVTVFGWPINSTNKTLTGTITSVSGNYDSTDLIIPEGMQGSTAVSLTNGCIIGQINSNGQILDIVQQKYLFGY